VVNAAPATYHYHVNLPAGTFDHSIDFDPDRPLDELLKAVPARWVVYLFTDAHDHPIQLLCVKNLRASLKRRLGGDEIIGPSRKVNYRDLVRRIYWRRVHSLFETDLFYLDIARRVFPNSYRGMVGFDPAWFIHVNPAHNFPRYVKTIELSKQGGIYIGPVADKHAAARLMQLIEDAFDLCRYYNILVESPNARPCAYKEMGKCPAPCDGTISMPQYRDLVQWSAEVAVAPDDFIRQTTRRMEAAAAELNFEAAARIKQYLAQLTQFRKGPFRHARRLEHFRYLALQHGPRDGTAKLFLITPGSVDEVFGLIDDPTPSISAALVRDMLERSASAAPDLSEEGAERLGVVADHLFRAKRISGVFVPIEDLDEKSLRRAWRDLQKQTGQVESEDEGVVKELQQI
jgi:excinuclease UvrABC nuclease subunit